MTTAVTRFEPQSPDDAATALHEAARNRLRVGFVGGGTHGGAGVRDVDAVLATPGLARVLEYAPADQTVTVEAGITLAALSRTLAGHGQRLIVEVAEPERATLGGSLAANASGPRRMCYGSLKDLILGVALVRADGSPAHAGGKVVKNVAGFDLSKLMVGSYGTLALVTSATLRVHPLAEATQAFRSGPMTAARVWEFVTATRAARLEPAALIAARSPDGSYRIDVILEGFAPGVTAKAEALAALATGGGWTLAEIEPRVAEEQDAEVRRSGSLRMRCTLPAASFAEVDRAALGPLLETLDGAVTVAYPALGIAFAAGTPRGGDARAALLSARADVERRGGSLIVEAAPAGGEPLERWGTPPPSFALMQQLKNRFDPDARLNPRAFVGGL